MPTLWLVGMMGSGKSTVAPLVAAELGCEWADTDLVVESAAGRDVAALVAESETAFRLREAEAVGELAGKALVVACGGGVVTIPGAVQAMRDSGLVVWLEAPADELVARLGDGSGRPLLHDDPAEAVGRLLSVRTPLYAEAAHVVVNCGGLSPADVADEVVREWQSWSSQA